MSLLDKIRELLRMQPAAPPPRLGPAGRRALSSPLPGPARVRTRAYPPTAREEERANREDMQRWLDEVHAAFDFLSRDYGASVSDDTPVPKGPALPPATVTYTLPTLSLEVSQDGRDTAALLRVPLSREGGAAETFQFDPVELVWHVYTLGSPRRDWGDPFPPLRLGATPAGIARQLVPRCAPELRGELAAFCEIVALRQAGGANPQRPRWRRFTTRRPISAVDDWVNLPSPDGRHVATFRGMEMCMSCPVRGRLALSNGTTIGDAASVMAWSDDSKHLAFLRVDVMRREASMAVVRPADGTIRDVPGQASFWSIASFTDGFVTQVDGRTTDVRAACV